MQMSSIAAPLEGVRIFEYSEFGDDRGGFAEVYRKSTYSQHELPEMVQQNQSRSARGVLRGLHFQNNPAALGKLIRCVQGSIFDVAVNLQKSSVDYGKWFGLELSGADTKMLYVPEGFAHGFLTLEDNTIVNYSQTGYWNQELERSILWSDPEIGIEWPLSLVEKVELSGKDNEAPLLINSDHNF